MQPQKPFPQNCNSGPASHNTLKEEVEGSINAPIKIISLFECLPSCWRALLVRKMFHFWYEHYQRRRKVESECIYIQVRRRTFEYQSEKKLWKARKTGLENLMGKTDRQKAQEEKKNTITIAASWIVALLRLLKFCNYVWNLYQDLDLGLRVWLFLLSPSRIGMMGKKRRKGNIKIGKRINYDYHLGEYGQEELSVNLAALQLYFPASLGQQRYWFWWWVVEYFSCD